MSRCSAKVTDLVGIPKYIRIQDSIIVVANVYDQPPSGLQSFPAVIRHFAEIVWGIGHRRKGAELIGDEVVTWSRKEASVTGTEIVTTKQMMIPARHTTPAARSNKKTTLLTVKQKNIAAGTVVNRASGQRSKLITKVTR